MVKNAVRHLNPGQIPIIAFDQPLYALAKLIQWYWPDAYGEHKALVMFRGLHVEMTALKAVGKWLEGSGWTSALVQVIVASPGIADSFLKATHVSRTRHAHQVTASTLNILIYSAYQEYCERLDEDDLLEFKACCLMREAECPQFQYWSITLQFELTILTFVKSLRERNFRLYIDALTALMPCFFALNHSNYARWLPVHIRDMISLKESHSPRKLCC